MVSIEWFACDTGYISVSTPVTPPGWATQMTTLLKQQTDYHTAMIGKWHLGTTPGYAPTYHGTPLSYQ